MNVLISSVRILTPRDSLRELCNGAANKHGVTHEDLMGASRKRRVVLARFEVWDGLRSRRWSFTKIGRLFSRDHATIIHGVNRHRALVREEAA